MDLVLVTPPAAQVLDLDEAKVHLKLEPEDNEQDDLVTSLILAATSWLDGHAGLLGRCLVSQTWAVHYDACFPGWRIPLPLTPLLSVTSIQYTDAGGVVRTVDPSVYTVLDGPACAIQPAYGQAWPAPRSQARAVTITFVAGYGPAGSDVPAAIRTAMKLLIGHLYLNREAVVGVNLRDSSTPLPIGVAELLAPFRARSFA